MTIVASESGLLVEILFPEADRFGVSLVEGAMAGFT